MAATPEILTVRQLNRATLARQLLLERADVSVVAAIRRVAGMQAQEPRPPFVGLWTRVAGFRADDLRAALRARTIVRASLMRATIHLVAADDYGTYRAALEPVMRTVLRLPGVRAARSDLDRDLDAVLDAARRLLRDEPRTIAALRAPLHDAFPAVDGAVLAQVVRMLLPLAMVPTDHPAGFPGNARFAPAETLVDGLAPGDARPDELLRRYLAAFGPATAADAAKWSGLTDVRPALDRMGDLARFADGHGRTLYDLPDAPRPPVDARAPVRFLPRFDNMLLAYAEPGRIFAAEHRRRLFTVNGIVAATVLCDGTVAGTWTTDRDGDAAHLRVELLGRLAQRTARSVAAEGRRLLRFLAPGATELRVELAGAA